MALWKQTLAKLRGVDATPASRAKAQAEGDVEAQADDTEGVTQPEGDADSALARELRSGIEISIGDLENCGAGWRYRGHPVMVFGTDAPELEGPRRRDFFSQVHLYPCCGALESETRSAWVGTDLAGINVSHGQGPFSLCRSCLEAAAGRSADPVAFDFSSHVRSHGDSYFGEVPCYWRPGADSQPLRLPAAEVEGSCPLCGCASEDAGWQLSVHDARQLSLDEGTCLLCAERRVEGCLHFQGEQLLSAARARYRFLVAQAAKAPVPSWKLAEAILPSGWQPLLQSLQRILPPPELFFDYAESLPPAVLAWPALSRGVVDRMGAAEKEAAAGWNLWTRAQIEAELGFKMR